MATEYTRNYISNTLDHQEVEKVNELTFLDCKVYVFNNWRKLNEDCDKEVINRNNR